MRFLIALGLWAATSVVGFSAEVTATLRPSVVIAKERASLVDVAELSGDPAWIAKLGPLAVIELPGLGDHTLDQRSIRQALGPASVGHLTIIGTTHISRAVHTISPETLLATAQASLADHGDEIQTSVVKAPAALAVPAGDQLPILTAVALDRADIGDIPFVVKALRGDYELGRTLLTLHVDRFRVMPVATRFIRRGEILTADDIVETKRTVRPGITPISTASIIGQAARMDINPATPFTTQLIQPVRSVRGGQAVVVRVQHAGFELSGAGTALADGDDGQTIPVRRATDGRQISARITGPGIVAPLEH